jgi:predicted choloylglycine hydrolase
VRKIFSALSEPLPGAAWQADFRAAWPKLRAWYLSEGVEARPTVEAVRAALGCLMPELVAIWQRLCELAGDDPVAHGFLGLYGRPRVIGACSQAVWLGDGGPALLRNYDFQLDCMMGRIDATRWLARSVIAMGEAAWGCLDGMNEDGLVASLTFGGGPAYVRGFSISLMVRYVLETCRTVAEAAAALCRIPVAQSQNVTLLDAAGAYAVVHLGPDRAPAVTSARVCTNHQETVAWPEMATASRTVERHAALSEALAASPTLTPSSPPCWRHRFMCGGRVSSPPTRRSIGPPRALSTMCGPVNAGVRASALSCQGGMSMTMADDVALHMTRELGASQRRPRAVAEVRGEITRRVAEFDRQNPLSPPRGGIFRRRLPAFRPMSRHKRGRDSRRRDDRA